MSNMIRIIGKVKQKRLIEDMEVSESSYTVPWAYNPDKDKVKESLTEKCTACGYTNIYK